MTDKTDKLSSLMDGELHDSDEWFQRLENDAEMKKTWQRYHLARDVMKGQMSDYSAIDISSAVSDSLKNEPVILTPLWRRLNPRYVMKQAAGLAVAAAVSAVAVLSVQQTQLAAVAPTQIANASATSYQAVQPLRIRQVSFTTRKKLDEAVEAKLSGYLVNHNEFSKSIRVSGVMPYTRIVSFVPATTESSKK